jgi:hypothetical protein
MGILRLAAKKIGCVLNTLMDYWSKWKETKWIHTTVNEQAHWYYTVTQWIVAIIGFHKYMECVSLMRIILFRSA